MVENMVCLQKVPTLERNALTGELLPVNADRHLYLQIPELLIELSTDQGSPHPWFSCSWGARGMEPLWIGDTPVETRLI